MDASSPDVIFTYIDYFIFGALLLLSSLIGVYYGFVAKKRQDSTEEYLLGGKEMGLIPIAISLIVSHISGVTMLGIPTEIYAYGTQYWLSVFSALTIPLGILTVFYPVFDDLKLVSTFMYLELRFNRVVRIVASSFYLIGSIVFLPIFIYIPALAFNQMCGVNIHIVSAIATALCVFYTAIGGLRAVVWTDTIQFFMMFGAVFAVIILGFLNLQNPTELLQIAERGERLIWFDFNPSPFVRQSVWTIIFGMSVFWSAGLGCSQTCIQKLSSVPDRKTAKKAVWIFTAGVILFNATAIIIGLVMYANLVDCDPYTAGLVRKLDQVLPYFILLISGKVPGVPGLFVAGLFSAGLSSMSGLINTMSCIIYEDFLKNRMKDVSEKTASNVLKLIAVVIGIIALVLITLVDRLSTVFELTLTLSSITGGAIFGLFTTGMLCRYVNTKGAICGAIISVLLVGTISIGGQSLSNPQTLPMKTDTCHRPISEDLNSTFYSATVVEYSEPLEEMGGHFIFHPMNSTDAPPLLEESSASNEEVFWLFRISYMYYTLIGCATVWIVGLPISLLTKPNVNFDEDLLAPFMRRNRIYL